MNEKIIIGLLKISLKFAKFAIKKRVLSNTYLQKIMYSTEAYPIENDLHHLFILYYYISNIMKLHLEYIATGVKI